MAPGVRLNLHLASLVNWNTTPFFLFLQASRHSGTKLLSHCGFPGFAPLSLVPLAPRNRLPFLSPSVPSSSCSSFALLRYILKLTKSIPVGLFMSTLESDGLSVTYSSDRTGLPDLRLIHYNDVYHIEYDGLHLTQLPRIRQAN
jgi:hypothetical protein